MFSFYVVTTLLGRSFWVAPLLPFAGVHSDNNDRHATLTARAHAYFRTHFHACVITRAWR